MSKTINAKISLEKVEAKQTESFTNQYLYEESYSPYELKFDSTLGAPITVDLSQLENADSQNILLFIDAKYTVDNSTSNPVATAGKPAPFKYTLNGGTQDEAEGFLLKGGKLTSLVLDKFSGTVAEAILSIYVLSKKK